jgi:hypothetical protein
MVADTDGITLHATDKFGTSVTVQGGKISMQVAAQEAE